MRRWESEQEIAEMTVLLTSDKATDLPLSRWNLCLD